MSETNMAGNFTVPPEQNFDTVGFQGSMQQVLQDNIGLFVSIEFLIGSNTLVTRSGFLYNVGSQFVVLYNALNRQMVVCDIFSVKFVTFPLPTNDLLGEDASALSALEQSILSGELRRNSAASENTAEPNRVPAQEAAPASAPVSAAATPAGIRTPAQAAYNFAARRASVPSR